MRPNRMGSTNIAEARVVGFSPISLEHTDKLGKTLGKIAVQKCGVIKGRETVVSAAQTREAELVINDAAESREARLLWVGRDVRFFDRGYTEEQQKLDVRTPLGNYFDMTLKLLGTHQMENAAQAIALTLSFGEKTRVKITDSAVRQGVLDAQWPGRLEKIAENGMRGLIMSVMALAMLVLESGF